MPESTVQTVAVPPLNRVVRYQHDQVGNDLTATLMWCDTHHEPVWVFGDDSFECPHEKSVGWNPDGHAIVTPPWEQNPDGLPAATVAIIEPDKPPRVVPGVVEERPDDANPGTEIEDVGGAS